jgi:glycosyltransferase involved in cell wall biosynthesis
MGDPKSNLAVSIVIPSYNEADNLPILMEEIEAAVSPARLAYEVIVIDDASTDGTAEVLERLQTTRPFLRVIRFERNAGQSAGLDAGFRVAAGEAIVTLDGDLQNDPADIPRLLEMLKEYDAVVGWRAARKDPWTKKATSRFANRIRRWATGDATHDTGCSLKAFRREAISRIKLFAGMHRFLATLVALEGFKVGEVVVNHRPRRFGRSKYSIFNRCIRPTADLFAVMWMRRRRLDYRIRRED